MDNLEILTSFSDRFVRKDFRDRFLHEAMKNPRELHRRICHDIEKVFDSRFKGQPASFQPSDQCLFLGWSSPIVTLPWAEAKAKMDSGGGGHLAIKIDGSAFYAETEAYPAVVYAGQI